MTVRTAIGLAVGIVVFAVCSSIALNADRANAQPAKVSPKIPAALPPDVAYGRFIALIRGHLLAGDALVKERDWSGAHPHFMYPLEEIYGVIREDLRAYKTPPFEGALRSLAHTVQTRKVKQYAKAREKVESALKAADANLKSRQPNWPRFEVTVAIETLKTAEEEYEDAYAKDRLVHSVGYRTARGFILEADRMIEAVAGPLGPRNAEALSDVRSGLAELKRAFAAVDAPKRPPIDAAALPGIVSRIERAAAKLS